MRQSQGKSKTKAGIVGRTKRLLKSGTRKLKQLEARPTWQGVKRGIAGAAASMGREADKAARKTASVLKLFGLEMKLKDQSNHLQGLYAELGKVIYELQGGKPGGLIRRSSEAGELFEKIAEMRRKKHRLELEARTLKKAA